MQNTLQIHMKTPKNLDLCHKIGLSDYLGVIICNWWRKVQKIRIFANQNAKYTANSYEDSKKLGNSQYLIDN